MSSMFGVGVSSSYNTSATGFGNAPNGSYYASYLAAGTPGPTGPQGPAGPTGPQGPPGTIPDDIVANSVTAGLIATTQGVNDNSVQLTDAGIGFYENEYQYFSIDNNVAGGNTLRIFTNGVTPGVAMTVSEEGIINMEKDVVVGGQLVVDGPLDVSGVIVGTSAAIVGTVQANTADVNNITAAISVLNVTAAGGVNVVGDLTMSTGTLSVEDIALTGPDARISISPGISDQVITTAIVNPLNTGGIEGGGSVSYTLDRSADTPNNWTGGFYAVNVIMGVGGASIPFYYGMFTKSPTNTFSAPFNEFGAGITLTLGADGFGNTILEFNNTTAGLWPANSILKITKIC
jgi:hypothetical protein